MYSQNQRGVGIIVRHNTPNPKNTTLSESIHMSQSGKNRIKRKRSLLTKTRRKINGRYTKETTSQTSQETDKKFNSTNKRVTQALSRNTQVLCSERTLYTKRSEKKVKHSMEK